MRVEGFPQRSAHLVPGGRTITTSSVSQWSEEALGLGIKLINIGFGNIVSANRIISIVSPDSAPIKRIIQEARERGMLIDATYGRRTRAVIITDSDHVILSAVQPETVAHRLTSKDQHEEIVE